MKKLVFSWRGALLGVLGMLVATGVVAGPGLASAPVAANQVPLYSDGAYPAGGGGCDTGNVGGSTPSGYAVIQPSHMGNQVAATVVLQSATPNTTYYVYLAQSPVTIFTVGSCLESVGSMATNGQGNATGHFTEGVGFFVSGANVCLSPVASNGARTGDCEYSTPNAAS
jgi:hypothetical protein